GTDDRGLFGALAAPGVARRVLEEELQAVVLRDLGHHAPALRLLGAARRLARELCPAQPHGEAEQAPEEDDQDGGGDDLEHHPGTSSAIESAPRGVGPRGLPGGFYERKRSRSNMTAGTGSKHLDTEQLKRQAEHRYDFNRRGLAGRVVLVPGGAGGLGAAVTALLLLEGALPVVGYRSNRGRALALQQKLQDVHGGPVALVEGDI